MADTSLLTNNGDQPTGSDSHLSLPEFVTLGKAELTRAPSPGAQRALKAQTGQSFDDLVGPEAESADRYQTFIWIKLRRDHPGLRWDQCADVETEIDEAGGLADMDPTQLASVPSPASAGSGD